MNDQFDIENFRGTGPLVIRFDVGEDDSSEPIRVRVHHQLHDRTAMVMADGMGTADP